MTKITVYDPAMCCSTGICGAEIDQNLVNFAADLDWLKSTGIDVIRINLSQEPALFAENHLVKSVLENAGVEGLPVVIIDDALQSSGRYPARKELAAMAGVELTGQAEATTQTSGCCGDATSEPASSGCC